MQTENEIDSRTLAYSLSLVFQTIGQLLFTACATEGGLPCLVSAWRALTEQLRLLYLNDRTESQYAQLLAFQSVAAILVSFGLDSAGEGPEQPCVEPGDILKVYCEIVRAAGERIRPASMNSLQ